MLMIFLAAIVILAVVVFAFVQRPEFGKLPSGERLERVKRSPNFKNGRFENLNPTPSLTEGASYRGVLREFIFNKNKRSKPAVILPSKKIDLWNLPSEKNVLVWFGHSSYFLQIDSKKILVDPVLSGSASPVKFTTRSYPGSDVYHASDIPEIDYLFISHDHWDHLDHATIVALKSKIGKVICGLGVGAHLEHWGYDNSKIIESDWDEELILDAGFKVNTASARHFSGRGFKRQPTLWMSYILNTPSMKIFMGGDSGYDTHFSSIGKTHGPFDLAILECGQYNKNWKYIHMMPEEIIQAATDLNVKRVIPVHWSKFTLAQHAWDEPVKLVTAANKKGEVDLITPLIGEEVDLNNPVNFTEWWVNIQ